MSSTGRPDELDEDRLNHLVHQNPRSTTRELHRLCSAPTPPSSVTCTRWGRPKSLLARHKLTYGHKQRFLYRIVTGDEKWCLYVNMKQRKEWLSPKNRQHRGQNKNFIHGKRCCACGGTGEESSTTSCLNGTKPSARNCMFSKCSG
ncbi:hypothetical protein COOONC_02048 [Cooperia oncophora]